MHSSSNDFIIILYSVQSQWTEIDATSHRSVDVEYVYMRVCGRWGKECIHTTKVSLSLGGILGNLLANLKLLYLHAGHTQTFLLFLIYIAQACHTKDLRCTHVDTCERE